MCETNLLANHREPEQAPAITTMYSEDIFYSERLHTLSCFLSFFFSIFLYHNSSHNFSLSLNLSFSPPPPPTIRRPVPTPLFVSYNNNFSLECSSSYLFVNFLCSRFIFCSIFPTSKHQPYIDCPQN